MLLHSENLRQTKAFFNNNKPNERRKRKHNNNQKWFNIDLNNQNNIPNNNQTINMKFYVYLYVN